MAFKNSKWQTHPARSHSISPEPKGVLCGLSRGLLRLISATTETTRSLEAANHGRHMSPCSRDVRGDLDMFFWMCLKTYRGHLGPGFYHRFTVSSPMFGPKALSVKYKHSALCSSSGRVRVKAKVKNRSESSFHIISYHFILQIFFPLLPFFGQRQGA